MTTTIISGPCVGGGEKCNDLDGDYLCARCADFEREELKVKQDNEREDDDER